MTAWKLISSTTLTSDTASVSFTSIPNTYGHLRLIASARNAKASVYYADLYVQFNDDTGNNYSYSYYQGKGADTNPTFTQATSDDVYGGRLTTPAASATSDVYGLADLIIPAYGGSLNKGMITYTASENAGSTAAISQVCSYWNNTAAITSIILKEDSGANIVSGSKFYLYGLKNS